MRIGESTHQKIVEPAKNQTANATVHQSVKGSDNDRSEIGVGMIAGVDRGGETEIAPGSDVVEKHLHNGHFGHETTSMANLVQHALSVAGLEGGASGPEVESNPRT